MAYGILSPMLVFVTFGNKNEQKFERSILHFGLSCAAAGLQVLQEKHLIHRDLKPQVI